MINPCLKKKFSLLSLTSGKFLPKNCSNAIHSSWLIYFFYKFHRKEEMRADEKSYVEHCDIK